MRHGFTDAAPDCADVPSSTPQHGSAFLQQDESHGWPFGQAWPSLAAAAAAYLDWKFNCNSTQGFSSTGRHEQVTRARGRPMAAAPYLVQKEGCRAPGASAVLSRACTQSLPRTCEGVHEDDERGQHHHAPAHVVVPACEPSQPRLCPDSAELPAKPCQSGPCACVGDL